MVAPGYTPTPDDDAPSAYQPGGRRRPLPLSKRYNLAATKRGAKGRAARYAAHKKKVAKRRKVYQMPLTYTGENTPEWWTAGKTRLRNAGWEVDELYAGQPGSPGSTRPLRMPRCRRPGGAWYYPESERDVEWLIASTLAGRKA
jgi:hypothetical protein